MAEYAGRWCTWRYNGSQCCGEPTVCVYPSNLERIQHGCGQWIVTPRVLADDSPIPERGQVYN